MKKEMIQVGDQAIAIYRSGGSGPAALLVHGNSASSHSFQHQMEGALGQAYQLVAMDLPGHGDSAPAADPTVGYGPAGYAQTVVGVAQQLGLEKGVFVGWSLGGHILLEAANQLPEAAGFFIFGTPPIAIPPAMELAFLPNPSMAAAFTPTLSEEMAAAFATACFKPETAVPPQFITDIHRTDGLARAYLGANIQTANYRDEVEVVANLTQPLAILHGEHEQLVNGSYFSTLTMPTLWRGQLHLITDSGHTPQWEQPDQFNRLLQAFLDETSQGTQP